MIDISLVWSGIDKGVQHPQGRLNPQAGGSLEWLRLQGERVRVELSPGKIPALSSISSQTAVGNWMRGSMVSVTDWRVSNLSPSMPDKALPSQPPRR